MHCGGVWLEMGAERDGWGRREGMGGAGKEIVWGMGWAEQGVDASGR